jgi:hypothetical protein
MDVLPVDHPNLGFRYPHASGARPAPAATRKGTRAANLRHHRPARPVGCTNSVACSNRPICSGIVFVHRTRCVGAERSRSARGGQQPGSREALQRRYRGAVAGAGSAAAVGSRRRASSLRRDGRAAAVIAAMACARWTKATPTLVARTDGSSGCQSRRPACGRCASCNHSSGSRDGCKLSPSRRCITGPTPLRAPVERSFFTPQDRRGQRYLVSGKAAHYAGGSADATR